LKEDVIFVGRTSSPEHYYKIMDIFISSSVVESTPLVIYEAMSMELPVIASDIIGGISEQVLEEKTGFVYEVKNVF